MIYSNIHVRIDLFEDLAESLNVPSPRLSQFDFEDWKLDDVRILKNSMLGVYRAKGILFKPMTTGCFASAWSHNLRSKSPLTLSTESSHRRDKKKIFVIR